MRHEYHGQVGAKVWDDQWSRMRVNPEHRCRRGGCAGEVSGNLAGETGAVESLLAALGEGVDHLYYGATQMLR